MNTLTRKTFVALLAGALASTLATGLPATPAPPPADSPSVKAAQAGTAATPSVGPSIPASIISALAAPASSAEVTKGDDGYWRVGFEHLASFPYAQPPPHKAPVSERGQDIPEKVRALDGQRVCIRGYMLPVKIEKNGFVTEFLLLRSPMMCCYGVVPAPNEWVVVKMKGKGAVPLMDVPLKFYGTLHVGEVYEDQMFAGIYALDGEKVSVN